MEVSLKRGDKVKRGQQIGVIGNKQYLHLGTRCSKKKTNPHELWIDGPGKIVCFDPNASYKSNGKFNFTYPVKCE